MKNTCDPTYCGLCAAAIFDRIKVVRKLFDPVLKGKDIDAVHDMRVASRRLRAALAVFGPCLPNEAQTWRREIRRLTRSLGMARDLDVQIEFVRAFKKAKSSAPLNPGLDQLLERLSRGRAAAQDKVAKALSRVAGAGAQ